MALMMEMVVGMVDGGARWNYRRVRREHFYGGKNLVFSG